MYQFLDGKKVTVSITCTYLFGRGWLSYSGVAICEGTIITIQAEYNGLKTVCEIDTTNVKNFEFSKSKMPNSDFHLSVELNA